METNEHFSALVWLTSPEGGAMLAEAAALPSDRLTRIQRLRKRFPADIVTVAVELLESRGRARKKFDAAERMFFTPEGLEQSTGQQIARYRAMGFPPGMPILDVCCGVGGDAIAFAERGPVMAIDASPVAALCTRSNAAVVLSNDMASRVHVACCAAENLDLARYRGVAAAAFCDPSRRVTDRTGARIRTHSLDDYSPPVSWIRELRAHFADCAVKMSPAADDMFLQASGAKVEFVSDQGECKEADLWFGSLGPVPTANIPSSVGEGYYATVLRSGTLPATLCQFDCDPPRTSPPLEWLYEPDPAVIRAHLIPQVAALLNAYVLQPGVAYLTSSTQTETPFAKAYPILDSMPYDVHAIQRWMRGRHRRVEVVKRRGVELEPDVVRKQINSSTPGDGASTTVVLTRIETKAFAVLCDTVR